MYQPSQDSYFLSEQLEKVIKNNSKNIKILDMGSGSGIQVETCLKLKFTNILCTDIDKESVKYLKSKFSKIKSIKAIKSKLFENIKGKFDLIIFNPPYLAEHKLDKAKDISGGKHGDETILAFLEQAKSHLNKQGKILLLLSSLTPRKRINKLLIKLNYNKETLATKKLFFEHLEILLLKISGPENP